MNGCIKRKILRIILFCHSRKDVLSEIRIAETGFESLYPDFLSWKRLEFKKIFPFTIRGGLAGISEYPDGCIFHRKPLIGGNSPGDTERYEVFIACIRESGTEIIPLLLGFFVFPLQREKVGIVLKDSRSHSGGGRYPIRNILTEGKVFPFFDRGHAWLNEIIELEEFGFFRVFDGTCIDDGTFLESGFICPDILYIFCMRLKVVRGETIDTGLTEGPGCHFETYLLGRVYIRKLRETLDKAF